MPRQTRSGPLRRARQAWNLLYADAARARAVAESARDAAQRAGDQTAEGWSRLTLGVHLLSYGSAAQARAELKAARACFDDPDSRAAWLVAEAAIARSTWREGRVREALARVLPLRDEGARVLRHEQRGMLLNTIAGCYSAMGDSSQAFAYMYEALRDAGPRSGHGYDAVLHNNLAHELAQTGDYEHALQHVEQGLARSQTLNNGRVRSALLINRMICLTELDRAAEALPTVHEALAIPDPPGERSVLAGDCATLAISALRAGDLKLGAQLIERARADDSEPLPDERLELVIAEGLLTLQRGQARAATTLLQAALDDARRDGGDDGASLRMRAQYFGVLSEARQSAGQAAAALEALQQWQHLHREQARQASRARVQAAALHTELLQLQHRLEENDARRRRTERARAELAAINGRLSRKIEEVQALQEALREQATRDPLTGLFNRRHLNDALPTLFALARREAQPMALAIIDLDRFKDVNDRHGHAVGDRLLEAFGKLLSSPGRRSDVACRYGGEEFCLLMPRTRAGDARRKLQALLRRWRTRSFDLGAVTLTGLSFSAGVADTLLVDASPDALLKVADDLLLQAKREGRGRVIVASGRTVDVAGDTSPSEQAQRGRT